VLRHRPGEPFEVRLGPHADERDVERTRDAARGAQQHVLRLAPRDHADYGSIRQRRNPRACLGDRAGRRRIE
jgi:hypothetical protein